MQCAEELRRAIEEATPRLRALGEQSAVPRSPGKWSPREIVGHLLDSASNNHQRFVRAQLQDDLVFPGYAQDEWVRIGRYADADWDDLVSLCRLLNLQIARVMEGTPDASRQRPRPTHNFEVIGVELADGEPATLQHIMTGYVNHLRHHLAQIFG